MPQYSGKDIKELTDQELVNASFALQNILNKALDRRNHPKYKEKFKNQSPPEINPAFSNLRNEIKAEIEKRNSLLTSDELEILTEDELNTLRANDLETSKALKEIAKQRIKEKEK